MLSFLLNYRSVFSLNRVFSSVPALFLCSLGYSLVTLADTER